MAPGCNLTLDSFARWKVKDRSTPLNLKALVIPHLVHYYSPEYLSIRNSAYQCSHSLYDPLNYLGITNHARMSSGDQYGIACVKRWPKPSAH